MDNYEFIPELYNMIKKGSSDEDLAGYIANKGLKYGKKMIENTFKRANKKDNITEMLREYDLGIGDTVQSRMTNRIGTVYGIKADGRTVEINWENKGGRQNISKESLFKISNKKVEGKFGTGVGTSNPYGDLDKLVKNTLTDIKQEEVKVEVKNNSVSKSKTPEQPKGKEVKAV